MSSVYTNDLRLEEIGSGEQSGSWGDTTNTNLELIAEAFAYGTETITTNANTHATTIADGATDPGRAMFLKYGGALDSACTITLGPNTVSKMWFIHNATTDNSGDSSGPFSIIIAQGDGNTKVTIPNGHVKAVYTNGAGSGAVVTDAFAGLSAGANLYVKNPATTDNSTANIYLQTAEADIAVNDVIGKINFQAPDETSHATGDNKLVAAAIQAISEGDFSQTNNATSLAFMTGASEAATTKMTLSSVGDLTLTSTTASTSSTTGSLIVGGGVGIAADLFVGDDFDVTGDAVIDLTCLVTGVLTTTAATVFNGGFASNANSTVGGTLGVTGVVTANAGVVVDTMTLDGSTLSATGDFILDSEGDIILDANGADFLLKDAGTLFLSVTNSSGDTILANAVQDKDIFIRGNDEGETITALTLDMSDAGAATFNNDVNVGADLDVTGAVQIDGATTINGPLTMAYGTPIITLTDTTQNTESTIFSDGGTGTGALFLSADHNDERDNSALHLRVDGADVLVATPSGVTVTGVLTIPSKIEHAGDADTYLTFTGANTFAIIAGNQTRFYATATENTINEDGSDYDFRVESENNPNMLFVDAGEDRIGIGTAVPATTLHLDSGGALTTIRIDSDTESSVHFNDHGGSAQAFKIGTNISGNTGNFEIYDVTDSRLALSVDTSSNIIIAENLVIGTSGKGIDFSAQTPASGITPSAEILDHYEEGTFTPVLIGGGTAGTYELNSETTSATYTRIGRQVFIELIVNTASSVTGGGDNYLRMTGLPFNYPAGVKNVQGTVDSTVGYTGVTLFMVQDASGANNSMLFLGRAADGTHTNVPVSSLGASKQIRASFSYVTAL
jgi:hypothetical protein